MVYLVDIGIIVGWLTLVVGVLAPVINMKKKIIITLDDDTISIVEGILVLLKMDHIIIAVLVFVFSLLFPAGKLWFMQHCWIRKLSQTDRRKFLHLMSFVSKWSMLDVFVVACLVVVAKLNTMADASARWGLYVFAAHVVISMILSKILVVQDHKVSSGNSFQFADHGPC